MINAGNQQGGIAGGCHIHNLFGDEVVTLPKIPRTCYALAPPCTYVLIIVSYLTIMNLTMFQLKDLPDAKVLEKFVARYPDAETVSVLPFLTMLRMGSDISAALDTFLGKYGLLQGRWWVLILLMREDNLMSAPSELAEKTGVTRATMTGLIDGLERDGLVVRLVDNNDRRKYSIKLTQAGQAKLDEMMPDYYRRVKSLMSVISVQQREELVTCLKLLNDNCSAFE